MTSGCRIRSQALAKAGIALRIETVDVGDRIRTRIG